MNRTTLGLALLLVSQAHATGLQAWVDRTQLALGESLLLTLESDDGVQFVAPDLSALDDAFVVADRQQLNALVSVDGQPRNVTRWHVQLQPRRAGQLVVPALRLGERESAPILLQVQANDDRAASLAPVFIDASVDHEELYVQAQLVLTLRIYHSVSLYQDSSLSPLQMADAIVERLGDVRTYEKVINGVRHGVIEVRYAIYPQVSGSLTLPSQLFTAITASAPDDYSPFGPRSGEVTEVKSPSIPIQVKPVPPSYPSDTPWLPARRLTLVEAWNPEPDAAQVGDSLTRSLMLQAEGLTSAQLPELEIPSVAGLRRYPDQPTLTDQVTADGVTGTREQRVALVPTRAGNAALPAIEVVWWNTETDSLERASLPSRLLSLHANPELEQPPVEAPAPAASSEPVQSVWPWQLASGVLAGTSLLGFGLWWRARRQPAVQRPAANGPSERSLMDDIRRACQTNDPHATRQALDAWARNQPETLADMAARFVPLSDALDGLNGALYSETGHRWQGEALWQAIQALPPASEPASEQASSPLPPLYPR